MTATQISDLPEWAFELPSSYYASVEVTSVPSAPGPTVWDQVEWFDGDDTLLGFDYGPAPGAQP